MKGIVFNLLEGVVTAEFGEDGWDDLLEAAGASGAYTAVGNYPDDDFVRLLKVLPPEAGETAADQLRWFGRRAMPMLAGRYDLFFRPHADTRSFLLTLNDIIHPEVRKLYPGADVPSFDFDDSPDGQPGTLVIGYRSGRRLCGLAEGFVLGAADHFGQHVTVTQTQCMHRGADRCLLECTFDELDDG